MNPLARADTPRTLSTPSLPSILPILSILATLPMLASLPAAVVAQVDAALEPGDEVRVRWEEAGWNPYGGHLRRSATLDLVSINDSYLVGRVHGRRVAIPRSSISSLRRRVGTKPTSAPAMVIGSGAGFAAGFLAGAFEAAANPTKSGSQVVDGGLTTGVLLGAPLGALVAYVRSRSRGIYEEVGLDGVRAHVSPAGSDGWRLGLRIDAR